MMRIFTSAPLQTSIEASLCSGAALGGAVSCKCDISSEKALEIIVKLLED